MFLEGLKFSLFRFKSTFSRLNRPHRKAPLRGGSLRSARYACTRYARHPWRGATVPTRLEGGWLSKHIFCALFIHGGSAEFMA